MDWVFFHDVYDGMMDYDEQMRFVYVCLDVGNYNNIVVLVARYSCTLVLFIIALCAS